MNICFISSHELDPTYGGTERVSYNLSQEMMRRGHNIYCCYMYRVPNECFVASVESAKLPFGSPERLNEDSAFLARFIAENSIEVMMFQSHHSYFWDVCVEAKRATGAKLIYNLHSDPRAGIKEMMDRFAKISLSKDALSRIGAMSFNLLKLPYTYLNRYSYFKREYSKYYRECDKFVMLSRGFIPSLARLISIPENSEKLSSIANPMLSRDTLEGAKKRQILFVSRAVILNKRPDRVLDMWASLYESYPEWSLVMVGDGADLPLIKRYAERLKLERVIFTGQTDPMPYFSESVISCVTSTHEGFGMVIIEAQQNGCIPVVFDSYESLGDIIESGRNGYIVPAFDMKRYADQMRVLMDDCELRDSISYNCRQKSDKFDICNIVDQWEMLFKTLLR